MISLVLCYDMDQLEIKVSHKNDVHWLIVSGTNKPLIFPSKSITHVTMERDYHIGKQTLCQWISLTSHFLYALLLYIA